MRLAAMALSLALAGCSTFGIGKPPQVVQVPVAVSCVVTVPEKPAIATDEELFALDSYRRTLKVWIDRRALLAYQAELEAIVEGCRR